MELAGMLSEPKGVLKVLATAIVFRPTRDNKPGKVHNVYVCEVPSGLPVQDSRKKLAQLILVPATPQRLYAVSSFCRYR